MGAAPTGSGRLDVAALDEFAFPGASGSRVTELDVRAHPGLHDAVVNALLARKAAPASVLDLGAGSGALGARLTRLGYTVTACDLDPPASPPDGVSFLQVDLDEPLPHELGDRFDVVLAVEVIEHLGAPGRLLAAIGPLLALDGIAIVSTPNVTSPLSRYLFLRTGRLHQFDEPDLAYGHVMPLAEWQVRLFLARGGLQVGNILDVGNGLTTYGGGSLRSKVLSWAIARASHVMRDAPDGWARIFLATHSS